MSEPAPEARLGVLMFATVSVAFMLGITGIVFIGLSFADDDGSLPAVLGWVVILMPAGFAALAFLFVARFETGRKGWAALAVLVFGLASTVVMGGFELMGLVIAACITGGFAVYARRLLDPKPSV